jgi:hypothetical protein
MNGLELNEGPDPQAEAMRADFTRAAGTDPALDTGSAGAPPVARPEPTQSIAAGLPRETIDTAISFAHEAAPQVEEEALKQEFNLASGDPSRETTEARDREAPGEPELKPEVPPEYRLPPDLQAAQDRLDRKLDLDLDDAIGLKKDRGPSPGF